MLLTTIDDADGWLKTVISPAAILKLCQSRNALCEVVTVNCEPLVDVVAEPCRTVMPAGLAVSLRATRPIATASHFRQSGKARIKISATDFTSSVVVRWLRSCEKFMTLELCADAEINVRPAGRRAHPRRPIRSQRPGNGQAGVQVRADIGAQPGADAAKFPAIHAVGGFAIQKINLAV